MHEIDGHFIAIIHPQQRADLVSISARERWRIEYRRQRLARKGIVEPQVRGEIGRYEGLIFRD